MNPLNQFSFLQSVIATAIALLSVFVLRRFISVQDRPKREVVLDGMRGYLAYFVFLHHAMFWYEYAHNGHHFLIDPRHFFFNYGRDGVALFFMITAFLFWGKLIRSKQKPISWTQLYISRIFRIVPLYLLVVISVFICVGAMTHFTLQQPVNQFVKASAKWWAGGVVNANSTAFINNFQETELVTSGVTWSLSVEWFFYFSLPLWGVLLYRTKINYIKLSVMLLVAGFIFYYFNANTYGNLDFHFECFGVGIIAAYLFKSERFGKFASTIYASIIVLLCVIGFIFYTHSFSISSLLLMGIAFALISSGNDVFGLLSLKVSRRFGQLSYSIYLLHGIVLYCVLHFVIGIDNIGQYSIQQYWVLLYAITIIIVIFSTLTLNLIEQRGIDVGQKIAKRFREKYK